MRFVLLHFVCVFQAAELPSYYTSHPTIIHCSALAKGCNFGIDDNVICIIPINFNYNTYSYLKTCIEYARVKVLSDLVVF